MIPLKQYLLRLRRDFGGRKSTAFYLWGGVELTNKGGKHRLCFDLHWSPQTHVQKEIVLQLPTSLGERNNQRKIQGILWNKPFRNSLFWCFLLCWPCCSSPISNPRFVFLGEQEQALYSPWNCSSHGVWAQNMEEILHLELPETLALSAPHQTPTWWDMIERKQLVTVNLTHTKISCP